MGKPVVLLPGWGNGIVHVRKLFLSLDALGVERYLFDYSYNVADEDVYTEKGIYAPFEMMDERFHKFLSDNGLLNKDIDIVGFSEGGMIGLYSASLHDDITIGKYVSISSPHKGAYRENFWWSDDESVTDQLEWKSDFLKSGGVYENAAEIFFDKYPMDNVLQIYSKKDVVSIPKSALRFESFMNIFQVKEGNKWHVAIPSNPSVIGKVNGFLTV